MKNIFKQILPLCLFATVFMVGCNDDDSDDAVADYKYVRYENSEESYQVSESSTDIIQIPVVLNFRSNNDVNVSFSVEGNTDAVTMITENNTLVIPADERYGYIEMIPIDNQEVNEPNNMVTITIVGVDNGYEVTDSETVGYSQKTITFIDDDCDLPIQESWAASVTSDFGSPDVYQGPDFTATFTPTGVRDEYTLDTAWGPNFVAWATGDDAYNGQYVYSGTATFNACSLELTIEGDDSWATGGTGMYVADTDGDGTADDPSIQYTLTQGLFTGDFTVDVVLTPN